MKAVQKTHLKTWSDFLQTILYF